MKQQSTDRNKAQTHTHKYTQKLLNVRHCGVTDIFLQSVCVRACMCAWEPANGNVSGHIQKGGLQNWQHHGWLNQYLFFSIKADFQPNCSVAQKSFIYTSLSTENMLFSKTLFVFYFICVMAFWEMTIQQSTTTTTHTNNQITGPNANKYSYTDVYGEILALLFWEFSILKKSFGL